MRLYISALAPFSAAWACRALPRLALQGAKLQHVQSAKLRVSRALHADANRQHVYELLRERLPQALSMPWSTRLHDFTADFCFSRLPALRAAQRGLDGFCVRYKRVHEPLFDHGPVQNAQAVNCFKQLLLFVMPSRSVVRSTILSDEAFVHSFVCAGKAADGLFRDELVCQLGLTLRANISGEAAQRIWQLIHLTIEHFRPTAAIEPYLAASSVKCVMEKHLAYEHAVHVLRLLLHIPATAKELASAKVFVHHSLALLLLLTRSAAFSIATQLPLP